MDDLKLCLMQPWATLSHIWFVQLGMQFFVVGKRKCLLGFFAFHSFPFSSTLSSWRRTSHCALSSDISGATPATGHNWCLLRVASDSSCSWCRSNLTEGTSESCQSRVLVTDLDSQPQTMILLKLCPGWKPCSTFSPSIHSICCYRTCYNAHENQVILDDKILPHLQNLV